MVAPLAQKIINSVLPGAAAIGSVENLNAIVNESAADALTAHAGGTQALGTPITTNMARFTVVATAGDSGLLPPAAAGQDIVVINSGAQSMNVFPATGEQINSGGANVAYALLPGRAVVFSATGTGNWFPILSAALPGAGVVALTPLTTNGAIAPHTPASYVITKAGVLADTLAAPTAGTDDGIEIWIASNTAFAHTLTATGLLQTGAAAVNLATFAAFAGAGLALVAYQGKWIVRYSVGVTFS